MIYLFLANGDRGPLLWTPTERCVLIGAGNKACLRACGLKIAAVGGGGKGESTANVTSVRACGALKARAAGCVVGGTVWSTRCCYSVNINPPFCAVDPHNVHRVLCLFSLQSKSGLYIRSCQPTLLLALPSLPLSLPAQFPFHRIGIFFCNYGSWASTG